MLLISGLQPDRLEAGNIHRAMPYATDFRLSA